MARHDDRGDAARVPDADELLAIAADAWAHLLVHVRAALHELDEPDLNPARRRLRAAPASRLAGGRVRRELCRELAAGGALWRHLHRRLDDDADLPDELQWLVTGGQGPAGDARASAAPDGPAGPAEEDSSGEDALEEEAERLRERAQQFRRERDEAIRRADGEAARSETLAARLEETGEELGRAENRIEELRERLDAAEEERRRAVERERRRAESESAELREEVRELRRREQERQRRRRLAEEAERRDEETPAPSREPDGPHRAVPGRPSELPSGVRSGTTEAVRALLTAGRRVIVDGYNVTLTHRDHVDLEQQRSWLVGLLGAAAARFRVEPVVVFDGTIAAPTGAGRRRGVTVRFSSDDLEADDEIEFLVAAAEPDEPLLVVTDDTDLRERLAPHQVDVVGTDPFLWAVE